MRIITGKLKGRRLKLPPSVDTRPTADRTKEGMFGIIDARKFFDGIQVLDLFGGSGNLGFEAISRGAKKALFVEQNKSCCKFIEKNAELLGISSSIEVLQGDVWTFINNFATPYDLVFADPPYDYEKMTELPDIIINKGWLKDDGWFILEHDSRHYLGDHPHCVFSKSYGRTLVTIFLKHPVNEEESDHV